MLTWAEINLDAIAYNLRQIKSIVEPKGAKILAVVKDNAYGHGAVEVARIASAIPVSMLGVATVEEAIELRQAGINLPVLVLCCILPKQAEEVVQNDITQTVSDLNICESLSKAGERLGKLARVHVKVDTGMGRIGICFDEAIRFIKTIQFPHLIIDGVFTHFAVADTDADFTKLQIDRFRSIISALDKNIRIPLKHAANSAAIMNFPESYFDMVRPGLAIYGAYPGFKPALRLKTRIVHLKEVLEGWSISYGRTYITKKTTSIATLPIGYGRGYNRSLSNKGEVLIRGIKAPIIGTICMDQCLCDVTDIPGVSVGDEVVLIGRQGSEEISVNEVAEKVGTISYEILCRIGASVPKLYGI